MRQNTDAWLEMRKSKVGASDAPIIMGESPYSTPLQLYLRKKGLIPDQVKTAAMQHGHDMEDEDRRWMEGQLGVDLFDTVVFNPQHPWMMASMDGLTMDHTIGVEQKRCNRGDIEMVRSGKIPSKWYAQLQHQWASVPTMEQHFLCASWKDERAYIKVARDDEFIDKLIKKEQAFMDCMQTNTPPPATDRDYDTKTDTAWLLLADAMVATDKEIKALEARKAELKGQLITLAGSRSCMGGGVKLSRTIKSDESVSWRLTCTQ